MLRLILLIATCTLLWSLETVRPLQRFTPCRRGCPLPAPLPPHRAARPCDRPRAGAHRPPRAPALRHAGHAQGPSPALAASDRLELRQHLPALGPPLRDIHAQRRPGHAPL